MKTMDPSLTALLNSGREFIFVELYTLVLKNGVVLNYTSADYDVLLSGTKYNSSGALFARDTIKTGLGLQVDNLNLTILVDDTAIAFGSTTLLQAATLGFLEGASIILQRLFMPSWGNYSIPPLLVWQGNCGEIVPSRTQISITCVSAVDKLNIQLPRNIVQPSCGNTLFDNTCALVRASFAEPLTVLGGGNNLVIPTSSAKAATWYPQGSIDWITGRNAGLTFAINSYAGGTFVLNVPPPFPILPGDTFNAFPGCDKTQATCLSKYNNLIHIRAMPYVPVPETAA